MLSGICRGRIVIAKLITVRQRPQHVNSTVQNQEENSQTTNGKNGKDQRFPPFILNEQQGPIHSYRSRVRVGRGHIGGHQTTWAGAVRSKK